MRDLGVPSSLLTSVCLRLPGSYIIGGREVRRARILEISDAAGSDQLVVLMRPFLEQSYDTPGLFWISAPNWSSAPPPPNGHGALEKYGCEVGCFQDRVRGKLRSSSCTLLANLGLAPIAVPSYFSVVSIAPSTNPCSVFFFFSLQVKKDIQS